MVAVIDAMPAEQFEDETAFSALVDLMCDPSGEESGFGLNEVSQLLCAFTRPSRFVVVIFLDVSERRLNLERLMVYNRIQVTTKLASM